VPADLEAMAPPTVSRIAKHPAARIACFALLFRVGSAVIAFAANVVFPAYQREQFTMFGRTSPFWDTFTRFDSGWYYGIARTGYDASTAVAGGRSNIAFFPVYPMLMRHVGRLFGRTAGDVYLGGIVVSWLSFVLAMIALYYLAKLDLPARRAERAVLLTAIFPFAFFFGVVYSESTFLLFTVLAFYLLRTRRWVLGGLAGAVASATRVTGIMMWPALGLLAWRRVEPTARDRVWALVALALTASGFGLYCLYIYGETGHPFLWVVALKRWGYYPGGAPWTAPFGLLQHLVMHPYGYFAGDRMAPYDTLNGVAAISFAAAVPFVWRRLGAEYALFMTANLWLPLSSGVFEGMGRYCAVMFPCFIWLASLRSRAVSTGIVVLFAMLYTLCLALFATIHPLF
jgi:Dolichyl-phosphate-mannose-protein mannosyltransferase